jgi:catechol-2,3-dioxygenase
MQLKRIHHVAYRCRDAKETVDFYQRVLTRMPMSVDATEVG